MNINVDCLRIISGILSDTFKERIFVLDKNKGSSNFENMETLNSTFLFFIIETRRYER